MMMMIMMMMTTDFEFVREHVRSLVHCMPRRKLRNASLCKLKPGAFDVDRYRRCRFGDEYKTKHDRRPDVVDRALQDLLMLSGLTDNATVVGVCLPQ